MYKKIFAMYLFLYSQVLLRINTYCLVKCPGGVIGLDFVFKMHIESFHRTNQVVKRIEETTQYLPQSEDSNKEKLQTVSTNSQLLKKLTFKPDSCSKPLNKPFMGQRLSLTPLLIKGVIHILNMGNRQTIPPHLKTIKQIQINHIFHQTTKNLCQ